MGFFDIFARITLNSSQFEAGAKRVESVAAGLGRKLAGYFTAGYIAKLGRDTIQLAGDIKDLSEQIGITTDQVQELMKASKSTGIEFEKFSQAIYKIRKAQADFQSGDKTATSLFARLGIDPNQSAYDILKQVSGVRDLSAAFDLVGVRSGALLQAVTEIHKLGPMELITSEQIDRLDKADKTFNKIIAFGKVQLAKLLESDIKTLEDLSRAPSNFARTAISRVPLLDQILGSLGFGSQRGQHQATFGAKRMAEESGMTALGIAESEALLKEESSRSNSPETLRALREPLGLNFQSSSPNGRASIGGFFLGADQTARIDIERQQLSAQKLMADRIERIEKQLAKVIED